MAESNSNDSNTNDISDISSQLIEMNKKLWEENKWNKFGI